MERVGTMGQKVRVQGAVGAWSSGQTRRTRIWLLLTLELGMEIVVFAITNVSATGFPQSNMVEIPLLFQYKIKHLQVLFTSWHHHIQKIILWYRI